MNLPNGWELVLVLLVVVLVFGSKRLPDSARALGRSMRILKAETKGLREDDQPSTTTAHVVQPVAPPQPVQVTPQPVQVTPQPVQVTPQPVQVTPEPVWTTQQSVPMPPEPASATAPLPYAGQQLFDAQGRPVQVPPTVQPVAPAEQAPRAQA